jgi:lysophospholipase L1-like esterase
MPGGVFPTFTPTPTRAIARVNKPQPTRTPQVVKAAVRPARPITRPQDAEVLAIGDSVMLGAQNYLRRTIDLVDVDAKLGRQVSAALKLLNERRRANLLTSVVVVHLGNNGTFSAKQFDEMMTVLEDVPRVIFLTNKVPRKWQVPNNLALVEGVKRYPNAHLVDWNNLSSTHPEYFWNDGIHLRPEGAQIYASLIADVVQATIP